MHQALEERVFISYSRQDQPRVLEIASHLEAAGLKVWVDRDKVEGGTYYGQEIVLGIKNCTAFVLMCSQASIRSRHVHKEVRLAWEYESPMLPLLLEPIRFPEEIEYCLVGCQWIEVWNPQPQEWLPAILRSLERLGICRHVVRRGEDQGQHHTAPTPVHLEVTRQALMPVLMVDCHDQLREEVQLYNRSPGAAYQLCIAPEPLEGVCSESLTCDQVAGFEEKRFTLIYQPQEVGSFQLPRLKIEFQDQEAKRFEQILESAVCVEVKPDFETEELVGTVAQSCLAALIEAARRAASGLGQVVFAPGEAGTGKSRLLKDFSRCQDLRGALFLRGYPLSEERGDHVGYEMILQALKQWFGIQEHERGKSAQKKILAQLGAHPGWEEMAPFFFHLLGLGNLPSVPARDMDQYQVSNALVAFFCKLAQQHLLILCFEDLQWADQSSLGFVERLAKYLSQHRERVLICGTFRAREVEGNLGLRNLLNTTSHLVGTCKLLNSLDRLEPAEGMRMVEELVPRLQPVQMAAIVERSEGIPLYIREILRFMYEHDQLCRDGNTWSIKEGVHVDAVIPSSVVGIIDKQLSVLSEPARHLLATMAVLGRQFRLEVLKQALDRPVGEEFATLCRAGLIRKVDKAAWDDRYLFVDSFTREVVYRDLEAEGKAPELHLKMAETLEKFQEETPSPGRLGEIGRHCEIAGDLHRAIPYLIQAGTAAQSRYAYLEAIGFYKRALEHLDRSEVPIPDRSLFQARALAGLGESHQMAGNWQEALQAYQSALDKDLDKYTEAKVHEGLGCCQKILGNIGEAVVELELAQRQYDTLGDIEGYAQCLLDAGRLSADQRDYQKALERFKECLSISTEAEFQKIRAQALTYTGVVYRRLHRFDEALACFDQSFSLLQELKDRRGLAYTLQARGILLNSESHFDKAMADFHQALEIAREMKDKTLEAACLNEIGAVHKSKQALEKAAPVLEKARQLCRTIGYRLGEATALRYLGAVAREAGDLQQARDYLQESIEIYEETRQHPEGLAEAQREYALTYPSLDRS